MSDVILDASALLALINQEPGADTVNSVLPNAIMSSVNISEVAATLSQLKIPLNDIKRKTHEIFLIADDNIVDIQAMMLISHYLPLDPIWLALVAPSSGGKTEFINAISKIKNVYTLSTLTGCKSRLLLRVIDKQ